MRIQPMYVPAHFAPDDEAVHELMANHGAADLVTATPGGLMATMLPFVYDRERQVLLGHFARNNDHWRQQVIGEALVIMRGPDSYITPSWYAAKAEHGRVVPTWNYITAHVYGTLTVHDDPRLGRRPRASPDRPARGRAARAVVGRRRPSAILQRAIAGDRRCGTGDLPRRGEVQAEPEPPRR